MVVVSVSVTANKGTVGIISNTMSVSMKGGVRIEKGNEEDGNRDRPMCATMALEGDNAKIAALNKHHGVP